MIPLIPYVNAKWPPEKNQKTLDKPSDREFRDALTRAWGATQGQVTNAVQWSDSVP
jgi:hypothetical protein